MKITNKFDLPDPVVRAITAFDKGDQPKGLRVTTLIDSPRISQLRRMHYSKLTEDVSQLVYRVWGSAIHEILSRETSNAYVSEERLSHEVDGTLISGAIDYQFVEDDAVDLKDYKSTAAFGVTQGIKPAWEQQLNVYAYLIRQVKGLSVRSASVVAFIRDWRQSDADTREKYPPAPIHEMPVHLWTDDEQDRYVEGRVRAHVNAEVRSDFDDLPHCTDEERWAQPTKWAVHKGLNKRALRVFDVEVDAKTFAGEAVDRNIQRRPGRYVRCESWCEVAPFCDQLNGGDQDD
jgi:hypothetical protein|tara:strand:+ start:988 stop:1857 length:870 start_codon:yes stop_codon:yes gene_type:complete